MEPYKFRYLVGIDPGKTGGIAAIDCREKTLTLHEIPTIGSIVDVRELNRIIKHYASETHIFALEDVHALPKTSAASNFSFGHTLGIKEALLYAANVSFQKVTPKKWQSVCWQGIPVQKKSTGKNDTKATSLIAATRLFPNQKFLKSKDGLIDAALIAKYLELTL